MRSAVVALVLLLTTSAAAQPSPSCGQGISDGSTRMLFQRLREVAVGDGCNLKSVNTQKDRITVTYAAGAEVATAVVRPKACASNPSVEGDFFAIDGGSDLGAKCPAALGVLSTLVKSSAFGEPLRESIVPQQSRHIGWREGAVIVMVGVVVGAGAVGLKARRRRQNRAG